MKKTKIGLVFGVVLAATIILTCPAAAKNLGVPDFDPSNFDEPAGNQYMPIPVVLPTTYVYEAEEEEGLVIDEITYTPDTTEILEVDCTVVHDVGYICPDPENPSDCYMTEETWDWYAWDNDGNVWYFGEDTTAYLYDDDWNLSDTSNEGSWKAGVDFAEPGIVMPADPIPGVSYYQEYYEGEAEDQGRVLRLDAAVSVEYGDYEECLTTKEWTKLAPGEIEHKYYAPGVGLVYVLELKGKTVHVELVDIQ